MTDNKEEVLTNGEFWVSDPTARKCALLCTLMYFVFDVCDGRDSVAQALRNIEANGHDHGYMKATQNMKRRFDAILDVISRERELCAMVIDDQTWNDGYDRRGLNACTFTDVMSGEVYAVFRGTGAGEWNDNGVALSGLPQINAYVSCGANGKPNAVRMSEDYLSEQQAQAVNWFESVRAKKRFTKSSRVYVCGHSKGGNKAQTVAMLCEGIDRAYSFNGQGFSPEALDYFKRLLAESYEQRRAGIFAINGCDDFVHPLGDALICEQNSVELELNNVNELQDLHAPYSVFSDDGSFMPCAKSGSVARTSLNLWNELRESNNRSACAVSAMSACERILGNNTPINGEYIGIRDLCVGALTSALTLFKALGETAGDNVSLSKGGRALSYITDFFKKLGQPFKRADESGEQLQSRMLNMRKIAIGVNEPRLEINFSQVSRAQEQLERSLEDAQNADLPKAEQTARQIAAALEETRVDFTFAESRTRQIGELLFAEYGESLWAKLKRRLTRS